MATRSATPSRAAALWAMLSDDDGSAHEAVGKSHLRILRHPLRMVAMGIAALAVAWGLTGPAGIVFAVLGAALGVLVGEVLGRSGIRLPSSLAALTVVLLLGWLVARFSTSFEAVPAMMGPHWALRFGVVVRFFTFVFIPVAVLRVIACRYRTFLAVELFTVVGSLALLFAAHRRGIISRPFWLSDWAWRAGLDPTDVLLAIGGVSVVLLTVLMVAETGHRITAASAVALPLIALLCVSLFDVAGLPKPNAENNLGLTGSSKGEPPKPHEAGGEPTGGGEQKEPNDGGQGQGDKPEDQDGGQGQGQGEKDGGEGQGQGEKDGGEGQGQGEQDGGQGQGQGQQDGGQGQQPQQDDSGGGQSQQQPNLDDQQTSSESKAAPMAVVLLGDDYSPPAQTYYFRQEVWSEFNGARLVAANRSGVDGDTLLEFPTKKTAVPDPPPKNGRQVVRTKVVMVVEHTRPFALETATSFEPAPNPNPERFHRAYSAESLAQTIAYDKLLGMKAGNAKWSKETLAHYTKPSNDPRFKALADEILLPVNPEKRKDPFLAALKIKLWMDQNLIYSTKERHAGVSDPTAAFLFGNRVGYCVHFAHSAVFLWRSQGIPARVSTGYAVTEDNRQGSTIMIRGGDAHAWPELYLDGVGWVVLDISAHQNLDPPGQPADKDLMQQLAEMARENPPSQEDEDIAALDDPVSRVDLPALWKILAVMLGSAIVLLYLIKIWRRLAPLVAGRRAMPRVGYRYALDLLSEVGLSRDYGETREAFARRVKERLPSFEPLTHMNVAARFGDPSVAIDKRPEHSVKTWKQGLRDLRKQVRGATDTWRRLLNILNPASFIASR